MKQTPVPKAKITRFFIFITDWPKTVIAFGFLTMVVFGSFIPTLQKDTSVDAFIPPNHSALIYRDKVKKIFGLSDPMAIAVINDGVQGVFTPHSLQVVEQLTEAITQLPGIDPDRVMSLSTENNVVGTFDGMLVESFFKDPIQNQEAANSIRQAVFDFPLYLGSLVAKDGTGTLIVAELLEEANGSEVYSELLALVETVETKNETIHVAGEGAVTGYLGTYIDNDAMRLNPLAGLIITIVLFFAYRTIRGTLLPNLIVAGTVATALGSMAALGVSFFVITNALPVVLIGIAVADSIHILGEYYQQLKENPQANAKELVIRAMEHMWRPITLTTLTTIAGFVGLALAGEMPPMKYFGVFAGIGVGAAWFLTLTMLPACLVLLPPKPSSAFIKSSIPTHADLGKLLMENCASIVYHHANKILVLAIFIVIFGVWGVSQLRTDDENIGNFNDEELIYQADRAINQRFDGTNYLDIVIETPEIEDLFHLKHLQRIEALQNFLETLPGVQGTTSIVDYIKQMNRALNEGDVEQYRLPEEGGDLIAQYFLLYTSSGDPTDFQEEIDYDYRLANVRASLNTGLFTDEAVVIQAMENYIAQHFNSPEISASLSGRVNLHYHWLKRLKESHFQSVALALILVIAMAALSFRSVVAGLLASVPVAMAVLLIYAVMGAFDIWLGVGTSMFAALAIGLGVDFSIHTLDQFIHLIREKNYTLENAMNALFPSTGRALLFNFFAIFLGFGVLVTSDVIPLIRFGALVGVGIAVSFLSSMTILPALIKLLQPSFLFKSAPTLAPERLTGKTIVFTLIALGMGSVFFEKSAQAETLPSGDEIVQQINARDEGNAVSRKLVMTLTDRHGKQRTRETIGYRKYFDEEKRTIIYYLKPRNVKGTGFLTYDYPEAKRDDDQWLYMPALRKVRRISASNRGDYFLGTDFTYEEIKNETKFADEDYHYKTLGTETLEGILVYKLEAIPKTPEIAKELGYSRVVSLIDPTIWISRQADFWDVSGNHLKTIQTKEIKQVQGIWTAHRLEAKNHKTGHQSVFEISDVDYQKAISDKLFTQRSLKRGIK